MVSGFHVSGALLFVIGSLFAFLNVAMVVLKVRRVRRGEPGNVSGIPLVGTIATLLGALALHDVPAAWVTATVLVVVDLGASGTLSRMHV